MGLAKPSANHDLYRALTSAFWTSMLQIVAFEGELAGEPFTWPDIVKLPPEWGRAWRFLNAAVPLTSAPNQPASVNQIATASVARAPYPKLVDKLVQSSVESSSSKDANYGQVEQMLLTTSHLVQQTELLRPRN